MIIECCSNERSYLKFYGLMAQRFCEYKREYQEMFEQAFIYQVCGYRCALGREPLRNREYLLIPRSVLDVSDMGLRCSCLAFSVSINTCTSNSSVWSRIPTSL